MNMQMPSMTTDQMMGIMKELGDLRNQRDIAIDRAQTLQQELTRVRSELEGLQSKEGDQWPEGSGVNPP